MKNNLFINASIKNGELDFPIKATGTKFKKFLNQLPDNSKLEIFIGVSGEKGSNPQLARVHAMIKEIAQEIGYSFADCDKDELNLAIQACIEIGEFNNMNLR